MKPSETINVELPEDLLKDMEALEDSKLGVREWSPSLNEKIALVLFYPKKTKAALAKYFCVSESTIQKYHRLWKNDPQVQAEIQKRAGRPSQ